jgi:hypothetical protein
VRIRNAHFKLNNMKNLTNEEQDYLLKHLNYDLNVANKGLQESIFFSTDPNNSARNAHKNQIPKHEARIEFLTNLINKVK